MFVSIDIALLALFLNSILNTEYTEYTSCSVIIYECCLQRQLALLGELSVDDKSFSVSGLNHTYGSLLCLCRLVTRQVGMSYD